MASATLTDADIARLSGPPPLSDADIAAHDDRQKPQDAGFFSALYHDVSSAPGRIMDFLSGHPVEDAKQAMRDSYAARQAHKERALDAYKAGDYKTAAEQLFFGSVPFMGPGLGAAADEYQGGQRGQAAAHAVEILGPALLDPAADALESNTAATIATGTKGAVKGAAKATVKSATVPKLHIEVPGGNVIAGAVTGGAAARALGLPSEFGAVVGGAGPIVKGAYEGARDALAARAGAAVPAAAVEDTALLEGLAQSQLGKSFARSSAEEQTAIRDLAKRIQNPAPPETAPPARPAPAAPAVSPQPAVSDVASPGKTIADIAREELQPQAPPATVPAPAPPVQAIPPTNGHTARPEVTDIAHQLFEEAKASGTIPENALPGAPLETGETESPEVYIERARKQRATNADTLAQTFKRFGVPASDLSRLDPDQWSAVATSVGVDFPAASAAQAKLIRDVAKQLRTLEAQSAQ